MTDENLTQGLGQWFAKIQRIAIAFFVLCLCKNVGLIIICVAVKFKNAAVTFEKPRHKIISCLFSVHITVEFHRLKASLNQVVEIRGYDAATGNQLYRPLDASRGNCAVGKLGVDETPHLSVVFVPKNLGCPQVIVGIHFRPERGHVQTGDLLRNYFERGTPSWIVTRL